MSCTANESNLATGWVRVYRSIFDDETYPLQEHRQFTRFEAKSDLLLLVRGTPGKRLFNGQEVTIERGSQLFSYSFLAKRWRWSIKRVRGFLGNLRCRGYIETETSKMGTLITIVNYNYYNLLGDSGAQNGNAEGTPRAHQGHKYKKETRKEGKRSDPHVNELKEYFASEYSRIYGTEYIPNHGSDGKALQELLAVLPPDEIKGRINRFLSDPQKQKKGRTIRFFRTCVADYPPSNGNRETRGLPLEEYIPGSQ